MVGISTIATKHGRRDIPSYVASPDLFPATSPLLVQLQFCPFGFARRRDAAPTATKKFFHVKYKHV